VLSVLGKLKSGLEPYCTDEKEAGDTNTADTKTRMKRIISGLN
jgi:hypothetical protein